MHSGSQMRDLKAQREALTRLVALAHEINDALTSAQSDRRIEILDIGGGLPTEPLKEQSDMKGYAELVHSVEGIVQTLGSVPVLLGPETRPCANMGL